MGLYFYLSVTLLALLLFHPVTNLIWTFSSRRLQGRLERQLLPEELQGQKRRARLLAVLILPLFSWLFNLQLLGGHSGHG